MSKVVLGCVAIAGIVLATAAVFALITMVAWNLVVPSVFNGPSIDIWQAWGINVLVGLVTGVLKGVRGS